MTRLSDAMDRAGATSGDPSPSRVPPADKNAAASLPRAWQFDDGENGAGAFDHRLEVADPLEVPPEAFDYRFGDTAKGKVVVGRRVDPGLVEQYRRLAALLHHAQTQRGVRSVMIASAVADEGKTLSATNIALTLSHSYQRRVLLIDADLRRPDLHEMFRLQNRVGLGDALKSPEVGRLPVFRISPTLWVLTAGRPTPDPMSGLVSDTMKQVIAEATQEFDWVVIDTPPVALMPDANLLASMVQSALLVVSAGSTPYPLVRRAVDAIGTSRILGVLLNRTEARSLAGGDSYSNYYYRDYAVAPDGGAAPAAPRLFGKKDV